jgi:hypothetical protein
MFAASREFRYVSTLELKKSWRRTFLKGKDENQVEDRKQVGERQNRKRERGLMSRTWKPTPRKHVSTEWSFASKEL